MSPRSDKTSFFNHHSTSVTYQPQFRIMHIHIYGYIVFFYLLYILCIIYVSM